MKVRKEANEIPDVELPLPQLLRLMRSMASAVSAEMPLVTADGGRDREEEEGLVPEHR